MARFYRYQVTPMGMHMLFPLDMLRYDQAFPMRTEDATLIATSLRNDYTGPKPPVVNLVSAKAPTGDRWESFGWKINKAPERG